MTSVRANGVIWGSLIILQPAPCCLKAGPSSPSHPQQVAAPKTFHIKTRELPLVRAHNCQVFKDALDPLKS